jgi:formate hydrogenlyase subunit 3/multisubunit Na+/H+ antiporter MnhD subunit
VQLIPVVPWQALPLAVVLSSFVPGIAIMFLREDQRILRSALNMGGAVAKLVFVGMMLQGVAAGFSYEWRFQVLPGLDITFVGDALALLFVTLSAVLWLVTTLYAIGYLEGSPNRTRFFSFFSLCVTATTGIAMAGDLFTFVLFYEALTWATYPLVVHSGSPKAVRAGRTYLLYTLVAGTALVVGAVWFQVTAGTVDFAAGGALDPDQVRADPLRHLALFMLLMLGMGVKAALVPLHGWLPVAMVAPAPVSALLHAVAVVKAGAFGVVRLLHSLFGIEVAVEIGAAGIVAGAASFTIVYGSLRALAQDDLKRLLAFSTVSQLSYIALGTALLSPMAQVGGLVHLVHQGLMKVTLFFCAGILSWTLGITKVSEMGGVARRMPVTMLAFSVAALGMIGLPPMAGFLSKWYLGVGALGAEAPWVIPVLLTSSLLNAAYFLPVVRTAYFDDPAGAWGSPQAADPRGAGERAAPGPRYSAAATKGSRRWRARRFRLETDWRLLVPAVVTATISLAAGLFGRAGWSPLSWTELIVGRGIL